MEASKALLKSKLTYISCYKHSLVSNYSNKLTTEYCVIRNVYYVRTICWHSYDKITQNFPVLIDILYVRSVLNYCYFLPLFPILQLEAKTDAIIYPFFCLSLFFAEIRVGCCSCYCCPAVNFINVKCARFLYKRHFSSYMYIVKTTETYIRTKNSYVKMLMKLTPAGSNTDRWC